MYGGMVSSFLLRCMMCNRSKDAASFVRLSSIARESIGRYYCK